MKRNAQVKCVLAAAMLLLVNGAFVPPGALGRASLKRLPRKPSIAEVMPCHCGLPGETAATWPSDEDVDMAIVAQDTRVQHNESDLPSLKGVLVIRAPWLLSSQPGEGFRVKLISEKELRRIRESSGWLYPLLPGGNNGGGPVLSP